MTQLPSSIEQYLQEAGFSATELLVLKRLLEGEAMTLRELAAKTGKSTGVLDQAMKKLIEKKIISKETINDTQKYTIGSLSAIQRWVESDMIERHQALNRKKENFDAFLNTVKHQKGRPDMEYFEGKDGMQKAFEKLLKLETNEWLHFAPAIMKEEEDPIAEYRVQLFRKRRQEKIFMRALTPDVPLGRRYQSRDAFEYRATRFVHGDEFPVSFEQYVVGDTVACIDTEEMKASFINFPQLADGQRKLFEVMWGRSATTSEGGPAPNIPQEVSLETKVLSGLREFFLSRKSLITLVIFGVAAGLMTWGLYANNAKLNLERIRDKAISVAATSALQFHADELNELHTKNDVKKAVYKDVIMRMRDIREQNDGVVYMYIMRQTNDPGVFSFVADADSLDPDAKIDLNNDGIIDDADWLSPPGEIYDDPEGSFAMTEALEGPRADIEPVADQWGTWISGHAPIIDNNGKAVAVIGVDINASDVQDLTFDSFQPFYYFFAIFITFIAVRMMAFHSSLAKDILVVSKKKDTKILFGLVLLAAITTHVLYLHNKNLNTQRIRERVKAIAATAAPEIDYLDVNSVHSWRDANKQSYQNLVSKLQKIRQLNPEVVYTYIMRKTNNNYYFAFVADADSSDLSNKVDINEDGLVNDVIAPGQLWVEQYPDESAIHKAFNTAKPTADDSPTFDEWGVWIAGHAPIFDQDGSVIAVIGVDIDASRIDSLTATSFNYINYFIALFGIFTCISYITFYRTKPSRIT